MANPTKQRLQELAADVRRSNSEAANSIKALLPLLIGMAKDSLVEAEGVELTRLQGEVRALNRLLSAVTVEPTPIKPKEGE